MVIEIEQMLMTRSLTSTKIIKMRSAAVYVENGSKETPLVYAIASGKIRLALFLAQKGGTISAVGFEKVASSCSPHRIFGVG